MLPKIEITSTLCEILDEIIAVPNPTVQALCFLFAE